jgi:Xaa-Pro aminopeptidase
MSTTTTARILAGIPAANNTLFHRIQFSVGDPAAWIEFTREDGAKETLLIVRDIELDRARRQARADAMACPADFTPSGGLSGDRETATAQALAECLSHAGIKRALCDRSLPMSFAHEINIVGITLVYDSDFGIAERRAKNTTELAALREAQHDTEAAMKMACEMVANATADTQGVLQNDGDELTSERVRHAIDVFLLARNYANPGSIVACGPQCADCHEHGSGPLRTSETVIIDIYPRNRATLYNGDCTRTVVHGDIPDTTRTIHAIVKEAKAKAIAAVRAGVTGENVHRATIDAMTAHGYPVGPPTDSPPDDFIGMVHGTGHGVGLDVHEPPLLDLKGPELVVGDVLTIEPGLYGRLIGGVRIEDMVAVTKDGCDNFNSLHEGLCWA